jgi:hypothetical protein
MTGPTVYTFFIRAFPSASAFWFRLSIETTSTGEGGGKGGINR